MPNPIQLIPAKVRLWLYIAYGIAGLVATSVSTYIVATGGEVPAWTVGVGAVLAGPLAVAFGFVAASNTTQTNTAVVTAPDDVAITPSYEGDHRPEDGRLNVLMAVALALGVTGIILLTIGYPSYAFLPVVGAMLFGWFGWFENAQSRYQAARDAAVLAEIRSRNANRDPRVRPIAKV